MDAHLNPIPELLLEIWFIAPKLATIKNKTEHMSTADL